jgi:tetratricopeptide (TPR) repeat protein
MTSIIKGYKLLELIGTGPLGDVYRARDMSRGRTAALKLVPSSVTTEPARRQQLLKDATAAASFSHPHVAKLWEFGQQDGQLFLAFEYVTGETLRALIDGRSVRVGQAVEVAIQVAEALDAARSVGLVHGDLTPANIVLTSGGQVKILDFGLAAWTRNGEFRRAAPTSGSGPEQSAVVDLPLSSPCAYLSPEQVLGERADHRSDVFSLGTILYEMLTGQAPFIGRSPEETALKIVQASPPPPSSLNAAVPAGLDASVMRALAKSLEGRYQASSAMAAELGEVAASMGSRTQVVQRKRAGTRKGRPLLRAAAILLALAVIGIPAWFGRGEVVRRWLRWREPGPPTVQATSKRVDPAAEGLYLQARAAADRRDRSRAIALYEQAIERDPEMAGAQAGLAEALYLEEFYMGGHPDSSLETRARRAAEHAVASNPALPQAQLVMGLTAPTLAEALSRLGHAIELDRSYADAYHQIGDQIAGIDPARAVGFYRKSLDLNPGLDANYRDLASAFELLGRTGEAAQSIASGRAARPDRPWWNQMQARLELGRGRYAEAAAILERDPATESTPMIWLMGRVVPLQLAGRTREALQTATRMRERYPWFCEGRAVLSGLRLQGGQREEPLIAVARIVSDAGSPQASAAAVVCAATAAASARDAGQTAFWLRRIASDEQVLRLWIRQAVFSPDEAYRRNWYPWNGVAEQPPVREAWSEIESAIDRLRPVVARLLKDLPSPSGAPLRSQ